MVHALEEILRLLKPGGSLIDIHPVPEGYFVKALLGERTLFAERKRETLSEDVQHAEEALADIVKRNLFVLEKSTEFDFLIYASTVPELRQYLEKLNAFDDGPLDETAIAREEALYSKVEAIMQANGTGAEVAIHERARIA
ncbi:MAG: hypothetical protein E4G99_09165, partial [Anaerolineales bacterium]